MATAAINTKTSARSETEETFPDRRKIKKKSSEDKTTLFLEWVYGALLFGIPFFFLGFTDDIFDLNKQTFLFAGTLVASIVYGIHIVNSQSVRIKGTFFTLTLLVLAVVWFAASFFSLYSYGSFVGLDGQANASFATLACLIVLTIIGANVFGAKQVIHLMRALIGATALLTIAGLFQVFGVFILPWEFTKTGLIYPAGAINGLGLNAALGLVLAIAEILRLATRGHGALSIAQILLAVLTGIQLITLVIFDEWTLWTSVCVSLGFMLLLLYIKLAREQKISWLVLPSFVFVFSLTMILVSAPRFVLPLQSPQLSLRTSFEIAIKALKERPFLGYGPGNFAVAYSQFRAKEINMENVGRIWTERFLESGSDILTKAVSVGLIGLGALFIVFATLAFKALRWLSAKKDGDEYVLYLGVVASLLAVGTLGALRPIDFTLTFFFWMLVGFFSILSARSVILIKGQYSNRFVIASSLVLFTIISVSLVGIMFASIRYAADMTFKRASEKDRALSAQIQTGKQIQEQELNELIAGFERAAKMNPYNHRYGKAFSQALVYKTSSLAANADKGQDNIISIRALAANAATASQLVVALNPKDARNMQNFADTLQAIFPFLEQGYGLTQEAYKKTIDLDPQNPLIRTAFAKFYLSAYLIFTRQQESSKDEQIKSQSKQEAKKALMEAERLLTEALELKSDYAEGYFHLGTIEAMRSNERDAIKNFDSALENNFRLIPLRAADEVLFYNLGLNYETLKQDNKAQTAYKLASSLRPNYHLALWRSALLEEKQGNADGAIQTLKRILQYDSQNKIVQDKIKELENKNQNSSEKQTE